MVAMQVGYFKAAWNDLRNSPGWFGKMLLLALVACIPIFGFIVVWGYVYGWARDLAWGIHSPLPARIFDNSDGRLYSRGFFVLVIGLVFGLLPLAVELIWDLIFGVSDTTFGHMYHWVGLSFWSALGKGLLSLLSIAVTVGCTLFCWVGSMRMSIYGRLSAGFQLGKIWLMIRYDPKGLLRIVVMTLLMLVAVLILVVIFAVVGTVVLSLAFFVLSAGSIFSYVLPGFAWVLIGLVAGFVLIAGFLAFYVCMVATTFIVTINARALGYWTRQFDVPSWRGQDDPMPFELQSHASKV